VKVERGKASSVVTPANTECAVYHLNPDPKDNYFSVLAVQNNCVFLITGDAELFGFRMTPVPVHGSGWGLKTFALEE
jgi:predicted nucleic acid-binding protein